MSRRRYYNKEKKRKRGFVAILTDAFAAVVIFSSLMFLVYDSFYLLRRYIPAVVNKVRNRVKFNPEEDDLLKGNTINLVKPGNNNDNSLDD